MQRDVEVFLMSVCYSSSMTLRERERESHADSLAPRERYVCFANSENGLHDTTFLLLLWTIVHVVMSIVRVCFVFGCPDTAYTRGPLRFLCA